MTKPRKTKRRKIEEKECYKENHPFSVGSSLIFHTRYVELDEQVRAVDLEHAAVVENLAKGRGVTLSTLQTYKLLSSLDFEDVDSPWYEAPVIVPINRDRFSLIHEISKLFAKSRSTIAFRWRSKYCNFRQKPPDMYLDEVFEDPCFYEYFVAGAKGSLHATVNCKLGLVNALPLRMHSFTMDTAEDKAKVIEALSNTPIGEIATIPRPISINVSIEAKYFSSRQLEILRRNSINAADPDDIEIDIRTRAGLSGRNASRTTNNNSMEIDKSAFVYSDSDSDDNMPFSSNNDNEIEETITIPILASGSKRRERIQVKGKVGWFRPSRVSIKQCFPIDLDFVITVNRSQGQTLKKVILAISKRKCSQCNFKYAGIYVAFSRVRTKDDIRLLLTGNTDSQKWGSVTYIERLRPGPAFFSVIRGFRKLGGTGWIHDRWEKRYCKAAYNEYMNK
jgi:hypothetical protein